MDIVLPANFTSSVERFLRQAGYHIFEDPNSGHSSFIFRIGRDYYPRFHIYADSDHSGRQILRLHLDQKKPSYGNSTAHSGEYDSAVVAAEAARLRGLVDRELAAASVQSAGPAKKSFFSKFFR